MYSWSKRVISFALAAVMLLSVSAFALDTEPQFYTDLTEIDESIAVTGSVMAAVSTNFDTESNVYGSFSSDGEVESSNDPALSFEDEPVSDYKYIPETGETLSVVDKVFPAIYPSDEEPEVSPEEEESNTEAASYSTGQQIKIVDNDGYYRWVQCLYVGQHCTVWGNIYKSSTVKYDNAAVRITAAHAAKIGQAFDSNYAATQNGFGTGVDADGDGKIAIFCYDIDSDYGYSVSTYTAGFFRPADMVNSSGYINGIYFGTSNYIDMGYDCIHIDTYPTMGYPSSIAMANVEECFSTLIHEYQHLINFSHWVYGDANGDMMPTYLNEAFSMAAEHMVFGPSATESRVTYFNNNYTGGYPLTYWGGDLKNYANSYMFGQYLRTRYAQQTGTDGNSIYRTVMETWRELVEANTSNAVIDELAVVAQILNTTKEQLILDFWAAVYLKNDSGPYGFNNETWADAIKPYVWSSPSIGNTGIGNGSCKFYGLPNGSYSPSTSSKLSFIGFNSNGTVSIPGAPVLSNVKVNRVSDSSATVSFEATKAGTLHYAFNNGTLYDFGELDQQINIVKGSNSFTVELTVEPADETKFWYATTTSAGDVSGLSSVSVPAYSYLVTIVQNAKGNITLSADGDVFNSSQQVRNGAVVNVSVIPNSGYTLKNILLDGSVLTGNSFTVTKAHTVSATYDFAAATAFAGGSGTQHDPYRIADEAQLLYFANLVNGGNSLEGKYIRLDADLDMTGVEFPVIGESAATAFAGSFDGNRHSISNVTITSEDANVGLFGYNEGTISDLKLVDIKVTVRYDGDLGCVGAVAGVNNGTVSYCTAGGFIYVYEQEEACVGGLVGDNYGTVRGCVSKMHFTVDDENSTVGTIYTGGIAGYNNEGAVIDSCSSHTVDSVYYNTSASSKVYCGGIVGVNTSTVSDCLVTRHVSPFGGTTYAGGVVGYQQGSYATISGCYLYCPSYTITAHGHSSSSSAYAYAGGIVGYLSSGTVKNCVAYPKGINASTISDSREWRGYIAGRNSSGTITSCGYYSGISISYVDVSTGIASSSSNLLNKSYLSGTVGMDFTNKWDLGAKPETTYPTPQALRRTEGFYITTIGSAKVENPYVYPGMEVIVTSSDPSSYVTAITVDGVRIEGDCFVATGDHVVSAETARGYTITVEPFSYGTVTLPSCVEPGKSVTITVNWTTSGYSLAGLRVNGEIIWGNSFTPTGDCTVSLIIVPESQAGTHGNLFWIVMDTDNDGTVDTLRISGTGAMLDETDGAYYPWNQYDDYIEHIYIEEGVTYIGDYAFYFFSDAVELHLPESLTSIGDYAFVNCAFTSVTIPEGVKTLNEGAFFLCSELTSIILPDSLETIGSSVFGSCGITELRLGPKVTTIGSSAFGYCQELKLVLLHKSVRSVGRYAFDDCTSLARVYYVGTASDKYYNLSIGNDNDPFKNATWYYISSAADLITMTVEPSEHGTIQIDGYTAGTPATAGKTYTVSEVSADLGYMLTGVIVNGVTYSGTTFTAPNTGRIVVKGVFSKVCDYVTGGSCGTNVKWYLLDEDSDGKGETLYIRGSGMMSGYSSGSYTPWYSYRSQIKYLIVEPGVTAIGNYAFYYFTSLENVTLPNTVTSIGTYAFYNTYNLKEISIPASCTTIYSRAFYYSGLQRVIFAKGISSIQSYAFYYCDDLTSVIYEGSQTDWNAISKSTGNTDLTYATRTYNAVFAQPEIAQSANGTIYLPANILYGSDWTVSTVSREGCLFSHLEVNGKRVDSRTFTAPTRGTLKIEANFEKACVVSIAQPANGSIALSKIGKVAVGSQINVVATPSSDLYVLKHITVDGVPIEGTIVTVPDKASITVSAVFEFIGCRVTVATPVNGSVTLSSGGKTINSGDYVRKGAVVTVTATPNTDYLLKQITLDGEVIEGTSFTVTKDHTVAAEFVFDGFKINIESNDGGSLALVSNGKTLYDGNYVRTGAVVKVEASPYEGYTLSGIYLDGEELEGDSFTVTKEHTVSALFVTGSYPITITPSVGGKLTLSADGKALSSGDYVLEGTTVTVTATPDSGYSVSQLYCDGVVMDGNSFVVHGAHTISAAFTETAYQITISNVSNGQIKLESGGIEISSGDSVRVGAAVTVSAQPNDGYVLSGIYVDGAKLSGNAFTVTKNHTVSAQFETAPVSGKVTGTTMAAVSLNLTSGSRVNGSFTSQDAVDSDASEEFLSDGTTGIVGYDYIPATGEMLAVRDPQMPEIYPSDEAPAVSFLESNLFAEYASYTTGQQIKIVDNNGYYRWVKCLYVGTYCTVWGNVYYSSSYLYDNAKVRISSTHARKIGESFDSNYLATQNGFGTGVDADRDGKVAIFCYDIDSDYGYSVSSYTAGFFRMADMVNSSGYVNNVYFGTNNYINMGYDCIHIDTYPTMGYPTSYALTEVEECFSTLVHEYQHLINFSHWVNGGGNGERMPTYLNEAFSMAAEHMICGSSATTSRITYFNGSSYIDGYPLTYWGSELSNYSNSYLFGQYLRTRYAQQTGTNGNAIFRIVMEEWSEYVRADITVHELDVVAEILNTTKEQLVLDFWSAVYLKESYGPFGFFGESWANAINPYVYSSPSSSNRSSIGNGGCKFYKLPNGSYEPKTSSNLSFLGFTSGGDVTRPGETDGAPQLSDFKVTRKTADTVELSFTSSGNGYLRYKLSDSYVSSTAALESFVYIVKGANTVTISVSTDNPGETKIWYAAQNSSDGTYGSIASAAVPAYAYKLTITQGANGTITLTSDGETIANGDYLPAGTVVNIAALPESGYTLSGITLDGVKLTENSFTVSKAHSVAATFTRMTNYVDGGNIGSDIFWVVTDTDGNGSGDALKIYGSGAISDYSGAGLIPWNSYKNTITSAVIEEGITSIGNYTFAAHNQLRSIQLPETLSRIGNYAFSNSGLESVEIPDRVSLIEQYAFSGCSALRYAWIGSGVTEISAWSFYGCSSLNTLVFSKNVKNVYQGAFANSGLSDVVFVGTRTEWNAINVYNGAFSGANGNLQLTQALVHCVSAYGDISACGTQVYGLVADDNGDGFVEAAFVFGLGEMTNWDAEATAPWHGKRNQITSVQIQEGVRSVGSYAFSSCSKLHYVVLPKSAVKVNQNAFNGSSALKHVFYGGSESDRTALTIGANNSVFTAALWHYNAGAKDIVKINVSSSANGSITLPDLAAKGERILVGINETLGYGLDYLIVNGTNVYSNVLTVPDASVVTVSAVFKTVDVYAKIAEANNKYTVTGVQTLADNAQAFAAFYDANGKMLYMQTIEELTKNDYVSITVLKEDVVGAVRCKVFFTDTSIGVLDAPMILDL